MAYSNGDNTNYIACETKDGFLHDEPTSINDYIINSLPEIIRLDKTFDEFSKVTGFDLKGFNDAVLINKVDLLSLTDGVVSDNLLKIIFNNLLSNLSEFKLKTLTGNHTFHLEPLNNSEHPYGDLSKNRLYTLVKNNDL